MFCCGSCPVNKVNLYCYCFVYSIDSNIFVFRRKEVFFVLLKKITQYRIQFNECNELDYINLMGV